MVNFDRINAYRRKTFRIDPSCIIHSQEEAIRFIEERGFIFFWPIKGIPLPSLWAAVAGDRPVADEHDDPGHITWDWKDKLLGKGVWYYGRVLARKNCMIANNLVPYFYALSPNFGDPETDYLEDYHNGLITLETKNVYEALLKEGPLDSIALRKAAHLRGTGSENRFNKSLEILQSTFRIVPCGISTNGAWHYSFVYDVFHRHFANTIEQSRSISEIYSRRKLTMTYLKSVGACEFRDISKVFRWEEKDILRCLQDLESTGEIIKNSDPNNEKRFLYILPSLGENNNQ